MDKEKLIELIEDGHSQREIGELMGKSQGSVKHWLKKYELSTKNNQYNKITNQTEKKCPSCGLVKNIDDFYKRSNREGYGGYCKICSNRYHTRRIKDVKLKMIDYKGGQCQDCHLTVNDSHYSVFEFHHLDQNIKDPNFNRIKFQNWDYIKNEIDKCVLLCANCHRLRHAKENKW